MTITAKQAREMSEDVSFRVDVSTLREYLDTDIEAAARSGLTALKFTITDYVNRLYSLETRYEREHWNKVARQLVEELKMDGYSIEALESGRLPYLSLGGKYSASW